MLWGSWFESRQADMKFTLYALAILACVALYYGISIYRKIEISKQLIEKSTLFSLVSDDRTKTMLILGDSTAVGVGAEKKEDTTAGRLAAHIGATYAENYSVSGAKVADLQSQISQAKLDHYSVILIHIGANDIIRFRSVKKSGEELRQAMQSLPEADKVLVATAGNVGGATFFPWFIRPLHTMINRTYHEAFSKIVGEEGGIYVNFYEDPKTDPFVKDPATYLAADGLHPSSDGYRLWHERILTKIGR